MKTMLPVLLLAALCPLASYGQQNTLYFPQIADGGNAFGYYMTSILVSNLDDPSPTPRDVKLSLVKSDGTAWPIFLTDEVGKQDYGSEFNFRLVTGQTKKFVSSGNGDLKTGFAKIESAGSLKGIAIFSYFDRVGRLVGEASVPATVPLLRQAIIVDTLNGYLSGIACANPHSVAQDVQLQLVDANARNAGQVALTLPPNGHLARFVGELFPAAPQSVGSVIISSGSSGLPVPVIGLRFDPTATIFTSLPSMELPNKSITVTSPAGGETFYKGDQITVRWSSQGISGPLQLRLDYPGLSYSILSSTPNDGVETITIPTSLSSRNDWSVVLTDYGANVFGTSKNFTILSR